MQFTLPDCWFDCYPLGAMISKVRCPAFGCQTILELSDIEPVPREPVLRFSSVGEL